MWCNYKNIKRRILWHHTSNVSHRGAKNGDFANERVAFDDQWTNAQTQAKHSREFNTVQGSNVGRTAPPFSIIRSLF